MPFFSLGYSPGLNKLPDVVDEYRRASDYAYGEYNAHMRKELSGRIATLQHQRLGGIEVQQAVHEEIRLRRSHQQLIPRSSR